MTESAVFGSNAIDSFLWLRGLVRTPRKGKTKLSTQAHFTNYTRQFAMRILPIRRLFPRRLRSLQLAAIDFLRIYHPKERLGIATYSPRIPWGLFGLSLLALTAGHIVAADLQHFLHHWIGELPTLALSAGVFAISILLVFLHRFRRHYILLPLVCAVVAGALFASEIHETVHWIPGLMFAVAALALFPLAEQVEHWKDQFNLTRSLKRRLAEHKAISRPLKALILFVSTPAGGCPEITPDGKTIFHPLPKKDPTPEKVEPIKFTGEIVADKELMDKLGRHPWQQLLRALEHHVKPQRPPGTPPLQVYLLASPRENQATERKPPGITIPPQDGSELYLEICRQFLAPYVGLDNIRSVKPVDFEDSFALITTIEKLLMTLKHSFDPDEIAIDITSGQKVNSFVGGLLTLDDELLVQYIQTAPRNEKPDEPKPAENKAYLYDLRRPEFKPPG